LLEDSRCFKSRDNNFNRHRFNCSSSKDKTIRVKGKFVVWTHLNRHIINLTHSRSGSLSKCSHSSKTQSKSSMSRTINWIWTIITITPLVCFLKLASQSSKDLNWWIDYLNNNQHNLIIFCHNNNNNSNRFKYLILSNKNRHCSSIYFGKSNCHRLSQFLCR